MATMLTRITGINCEMTREQLEEHRDMVFEILDVCPDDEDVSVCIDGNNLIISIYNENSLSRDHWIRGIQELCFMFAPFCNGGVSFVNRDLDDASDDSVFIDAISGGKLENYMVYSETVASAMAVARGMAMEAAGLVYAACQNGGVRNGMRSQLEDALFGVFLCQMQTATA